jgi:hypothetical protein
MPLLALLIACADPVPQGTLDVQVDRNPPEGDVDSVGPSACLSANGRLYVAWQDDRDGTSGTWFNMSADGGVTWMPADLRLDAGTVGAYHPSLACAGERAWVVWEDERDGELRNRNIYLAQTSNGGRSWTGGEVPLDGDPDGDAMSLGPTVVTAGDAVYVAWFDNRDGAYDIYLQSSTDRGATWRAAPVRVDTDAPGDAYSAWPRIAANDAGDVVVAWEDARAGATDVYVNHSSDFGARFGGGDTRLDLGADGSDSFLPRVAMDGDTVAVAWHDTRDGAGRSVLVSTSADGGVTWTGAPTRMDTDVAGAADSLNPTVAVRGERVHVAWQDDALGGYDILIRTSTDAGATFGDEARLDADTRGEAQSYDPVIALLEETVVVGWSDRRDDTEAVGFNDLYHTVSEDAGTTWDAVDHRINSNAPGSAWARDLHLMLRGSSLVAVWADGRGGSSDILAGLRGIGEESVYVPPPPEDE